MSKSWVYVVLVEQVGGNGAQARLAYQTRRNAQQAAGRFAASAARHAQGMRPKVVREGDTWWVDGEALISVQSVQLGA